MRERSRDTDLTVLCSRCEPDVVSKFEVTSVSTNSVNLNWSPPVGNQSYYRIEVTGDTFQSLNTNSKSVSVNGLTSGNNYTFKIWAVAGGVQGDPIQISSFTNPERVTNLTANNITLSSIDLKWEAPRGSRKYYRIRRSDNPENDEQWYSESGTINNLEAGKKYTFMVSAVSGDNKQGLPSEIIVSTYSSSLIVSLSYYTSEVQRQQIIIAGIKQLLETKFKGQNITAIWKQERKIIST
ncbi:receptor-type tyrosine-protein phosphatase H-like [Rhinophrynus dorsalis]